MVELPVMIRAESEQIRDMVDLSYGRRGWEVVHLPAVRNINVSCIATDVTHG
jgi:hypothetical protein